MRHKEKPRHGWATGRGKHSIHNRLYYTDLLAKFQVDTRLLEWAAWLLAALLQVVDYA